MLIQRLEMFQVIFNVRKRIGLLMPQPRLLGSALYMPSSLLYSFIHFEQRRSLEKKAHMDNLDS